MDPETLEVEKDAARGQLHPEAGLTHSAWSIRKFIELIDEAIDFGGGSVGSFGWVVGGFPCANRAAPSVGDTSPLKLVLSEVDVG